MKGSDESAQHDAPADSGACHGIERQVLGDWLQQFLEADRFKDYCPNGLQVEGTGTVRRLASAVTASLAVVREAARGGADALLVHHGYFWRGEDPRLIGPRRERIAGLLSAGINLFAYHLPLDVHPSLGNNARLAARMGWPVSGRAGDPPLMCWSDLPQACAATDLAARLHERLQRMPLVVGDPRRPIRRLAWCTGGAQDMLQQAIDLGADGFVSGEISERTTHLAREAGVVYFAAGHHATERDGVRALGERVAGQFGIAHWFIDDPNPV